MRLYAFTAIAISTVSVVSAVVILPWLFTSVHALRNDIFVETVFCKNIISTHWHEMYLLGKTSNLNQIRQKRGWLFGNYVPEEGNPFGPSSGYGSPAPTGYGRGKSRTCATVLSLHTSKICLNY
jgi:hypothetical protein